MKTHYIYTLTDKTTNKVFYVGCTMYPKIRERQHHVSFTPLLTEPPLFEIIDSITAAYMYAGIGLEKYWICQYLKSGCPLINKQVCGFEYNEDDYRWIKERHTKQTA